MSTIYEQCITELQERVYRRGINYSLEDFLSNLTCVNNPHLQLPKCIHVAGTNGKGSTSAILNQALIDSGFKVGLFSSPHISSYTERIQINNNPITESSFCDYFYQATESGHFQTEFEILTVMAFLFFRDKKPDFVIFETGLGGRFDTTNVIQPILSIITKIDFDHQAILGNTIEAIASEKAGIIKENTPSITISTQKEEVITVLKKEAKLRSAKLYIEEPLQEVPIFSALKGSFQKENIALAKQAFLYLMPTLMEAEKCFNKSLAKVKHWGRFTQLSDNPQIICDGAHNKSAIEALLNEVQQQFPKNKLEIILGIHNKKDVPGILNPVIESKIKTHYCSFDKQLAFSTQDITKQFPGIESIKLEDIPSHIARNRSTVFIITGSIYFISELKPLLEFHFVEQPLIKSRN